MNRPADQHDVERIARDVLAAGAWDVHLLAIESIDEAWHVAVTDAAGRVITTDIPRGKPAAIRAALSQWLDRQL